APVGGADLGRLLAPKSIAVVGSARECGQVIAQNRAMGFAGELWPVHPSRGEVAGERAYSRLADLPGVPDAAFVAVPAPSCPAVVAELAALGCGGAVVYSSGFAETGPRGAERQRALVAAAGAMPLLGPNCYGLVNYAEGVLIWPDQHGGVAQAAGERGVAVVSQSSSIAISVTMADDGLPLAAVVTVGNGARLGVAAVAAALLGSERVSAVGMIVESLADLRAWEGLAARARRRRVGLVALVLGRSARARAAVVTHTASLAGDGAAVAAFLRRNGIGRVDSVDALLGALCLLHCGGPLADATLTSLSSSGGEAALIADAAHGTAVRFAELTADQRAELGAVLGERVPLANPLDYHTYVWGEPDAMAAAFTAMVRGTADLNLLFADLPRADRCADDDWVLAVEAFTRACAATGARGALVAAMAGNLGGERAAAWVRRGLAVLAPPAVAMAAVEAAASIGRAWAAPPAPRVAGPARPSQRQDRRFGAEGGQIRPGTRRTDDHRTVLDEAEGKRLLRVHGVRVPKGAVCTSADAAVVAAADLGGPVAVKALGTAHKTDDDAVRLAPGDVRAAAADLLRGFPAVLVERLVPGGIVELLVGARCDPVFGPVLGLGVGGVLTELVRDVAHLLLPADPGEIRSALLGLRCAPLLTGYRGAPAADLDAAVAVVEQVAALVLATPDVVELEINPLVVTRDGAWACDALVITS
ncbi:MAG: acetate--CoA ligase family protein, partial [Pseudonocardia sp.]|nr:acetate--CoA ligase family protein [Pseudonocardia sp.]